MLQTIEAILEPSGKVRLLEPIHVSKPSRVLLTLLEVPLERETGKAETLLRHLQNNPLPLLGRRSMAEIDAQIEAERSAWD
jgi:hypothetical protein